MEVLHSCGHTRIWKSHPPVWAANAKCLDCSSRAKAKKALIEADRQGLPDLVGTERQVLWALSIRQKILSSASPDQRESLSKITSAATWIEGKEKAVWELAQEAE